MTVASLLSHLVIRLQLFYKINGKENIKKINNDLAIVASHIPVGAIHDNTRSNLMLGSMETFLGGCKNKV